MGKKMFIGLLVFLFLSVVAINAAYTAAQTSFVADEFSERYLYFEKTITFTATEPGRNEKRLYTIVQTEKLTKSRANFGISASPIASGVATEYASSQFLFLSAPNIKNDQIFWVSSEVTEGFTYETGFYGMTDEARALLAEKRNGYRQGLYFPPSAVIAEDYCEENNLIFNEIVFENFSYQIKDPNVLSLELFELNHTLYEENQKAGAIPVLLIVGIIVLFVFVFWGTFGGGIVDIIDALTPDPVPAPPMMGDNITTNIILDVNQNETYQVYLDLCRSQDITPTTEGYLEFLRQTMGIYGQTVAPKVQISTEKTQVNEVQNGQIGTFISAFVESVSAVITLVVIIIIIVIAIMLIRRIFTMKVFQTAKSE